VKVNRISLIDPDKKEKIKKDGLKLWRSKMNEFAALKQCIEKQHPTDEVSLGVSSHKGGSRLFIQRKTRNCPYN